MLKLLRGFLILMANLVSVWQLYAFYLMVGITPEWVALLALSISTIILAWKLSAVLKHGGSPAYYIKAFGHKVHVSLTFDMAVDTLLILVVMYWLVVIQPLNVLPVIVSFLILILEIWDSMLMYEYYHGGKK